MKRIICIVVYSLLILDFIQAKQLPEFVQKKVETVKQNAQTALNEYRFVRKFGDKAKGHFPYACYLSTEFSDDECVFIDSLDLNLNIGMIFDNDMRNRIVQLMRNEYREDELDTLINRYMEYNLSSYEYDAMEMCEFDTMEIFKNTLDSLYLDIKSKEGTPYSKSMYKDKVFKLLQLDTTNIYKQIRNQVVERERERNTGFLIMYYKSTN